MEKQKKRGRIAFHAKWARMKDGERVVAAIEGDVSVVKVKKGEAYANHVETAGFRAAGILSYGNKKDGTLRLFRHVIFPGLRRYPNDTHSSEDRNFKGIELKIDGRRVREKSVRYAFDGVLTIETECEGFRIVRETAAARDAAAFLELAYLTNRTNRAAEVEIELLDRPYLTPAAEGANRARHELYAQATETRFTVAPGETKAVGVSYCGAAEGARTEIDPFDEMRKRRAFLAELKGVLTVVTPDEKVNRMAEFAKIRATESIFKTKNGLMHAPGGGAFYAAVWTNDQCEYVNPLFGYLGYRAGVEQSENCFRMFAPYARPDRAVVSSIVGEGDGVWHGAGDRGDSAMYAYGLSFFLLARGDRGLARELLPALRAAIDFTLSKRNADGVVESDSDELENRFESGKANLSTSCIALGALETAAAVEEGLGDIARAEDLKDAAKRLKKSVTEYFAAEVEGFETYRYCAEEKRLRSWICLPLLFGIDDRKKGTTDALFSDRLRRGAGLATRSGGKTFWDRSTLYALRAAFAAGEANRAAELLSYYTERRLLGAHLPYAVEAYPEGNQAQLSAESGLYYRILTEGVLGYRPTGFETAEIRPHLPAAWDEISARGLPVGKRKINVAVKRAAGGYEIRIDGAAAENIGEGETFEVTEE